MSWESDLDKLLEPPEDLEMPVMIDLFGNEIYSGESYYDLNGIIISEDGIDTARNYVTDEEDYECELCGKEINEFEDDCYYLINGEKFCQKCVDSNKHTAWAE